MSSSLSNHDSGLNTVLGTISTTHDELQPASIVRGRPNSTKASSVMISGRAPTQGAGFTASIIPIEQRVTPTTASGDDKLLSGRECLVHKGGGETAGSAAAPDEAAAVSSCERECGSNDAVHTDTNRRRNNHSECDSSATAASTDKYSCDLEGTMGVGGGGSSSSSNIADHEEEVSLQVVQKATAEYSSSARESEAAGDYDHRDNNVDRDDHREPHGHDNYNYDDEGGRDNYYEDEEDDDDACRTPTASEYRIPDIRPCPPPPRKSRAVLMDDRSCTIGTTGSNGKLCSAHQQQHQQHHHHHGGRLLLDFSKEVESMFPPLVQVNLGRKIKKARTA